MSATTPEYEIKAETLDIADRPASCKCYHCGTYARVGHGRIIKTKINLGTTEKPNWKWKPICNECMKKGR